MHRTNAPFSFAVTTFKKTMLLSLSVFVVHLAFVTNAKECIPGRNESIGETIPDGDIFMKVGDTLEIYCRLNEDALSKGYTSDNIAFVRNSVPVDPSFVLVLNDTTCRLRIANMTQSHDWYYCFLKYDSAAVSSNIVPSSLETTNDNASLTNVTAGTLVCGNLVTVGTEPKDVENFTCVSVLFTALYCSWDVPDNNVETNYTVTYYRAGRPMIGVVTPCPTNDDWQHHFCRWEGNTYRRNFKYLTMMVYGENRFGRNAPQKIHFHHDAHIKPPTPENLELVSKTTTSIFFKWFMGEFRYFRNTVVFRVQYTSNSQPWTNLTYSSVVNADGYMHLNVTHLRPWTLYNFRVSVRAQEATDDAYWSEPGSQIFRTLPCSPYVSPSTDMGGFETEFRALGRHLFVYWRPLPDYEHNGDEFRYDVKAYKVATTATAVAMTTMTAEEKDEWISPVQVKYSYAKFEVDFDAYRVLITSVNKEGAANRSSVVQVPAQRSEVSYFRSFTKTDYGNGVYELAWELARRNATDDPVANVTLFWCESAKERPVQCDGYIDWEHFGVEARKHNKTLTRGAAYQFAVSANTARGASSGMVWAQCTIIHGRLGVIKNLRVDEAGQDYIRLSWMLDCHSQASVIEGYQIFYCAIEENSGGGSGGPGSVGNVRCRDKERNVTVAGDMHVKSGQIVGLDMNTSYRIAISILAKNKEQYSRSVDFVASTSEGPPDVTDVRVTVPRVDNVSALVEWTAPRVTHGKLQEYYVTYIGAGLEPVRVPVKGTSVRLTRLRSYTTYNVTVRACTNVCSAETAPPYSFRTGVGVPGVVEDVTTDRNGTDATIRWSPPKLPAGPQPTYEVMVQKKDGHSRSYYTTATEITVPIPDCAEERGGARLYYVFKVRAMNGEGGMKEGALEYPFTGNWSSALSVDCSGADGSPVWRVLVFISAPVIVVLAVVYVGRRFVYRCKQMKSVQVTIPIKFIMPPPAYAPDHHKAHDLFDSYTSVSQIKSPDECRNLVEKSTEFVR